MRAKQELNLQLTTQHLDYLVAVTEYPTWAEAAASRGVSPSALSQGLAELERRLGIPLFDRVGRRRILASGAQEVVDYARGVVTQTHDLSRWAESRRSGKVGTLSVGMIDVAVIAHFPDELRRFREDHRHVDLRLTIAGSASLVEQLRSGDLDLAIIVEPNGILTDLTTTQLLSEPLAVYAPPNTRVGKPDTWGPWVTFPSTSHTLSLIRRSLIEIGAQFEVIAESNQPDVIRQMVQLSIGWTVLPVSQAETGPKPLRRAQKRSLFNRNLVAASRCHALPHPAAEALLTTLLESNTDQATGS